VAATIVASFLFPSVDAGLGLSVQPEQKVRQLFWLRRFIGAVASADSTAKAAGVTFDGRFVAP
jgi:hypothetical protein